MRRRSPVLLAALLAALVAALAVVAGAPAGPGVALEHQGTLAGEVVSELNRVRTEHGLARLRTQAGLRAAATAHTRAMLTDGFFAHESRDGTPFDSRIRRFYPSRGWQSWSVGETLLSSGGSLDARAVVDAWLASPPHREIILSPGFRKIGISAIYRVDSSAPLAVTADFGHRRK
jgi:uncharacterized protein YkwD